MRVLTRSFVQGVCGAYSHAAVVQLFKDDSSRQATNQPTKQSGHINQSINQSMDETWLGWIGCGCVCDGRVSDGSSESGRYMHTDTHTHRLTDGRTEGGGGGGTDRRARWRVGICVDGWMDGSMPACLPARVCVGRADGENRRVTAVGCPSFDKVGLSIGTCETNERAGWAVHTLSHVCRLAD